MQNYVRKWSSTTEPTSYSKEERMAHCYHWDQQYLPLSILLQNIVLCSSFNRLLTFLALHVALIDFGKLTSSFFPRVLMTRKAKTKKNELVKLVWMVLQYCKWDGASETSGECAEAAC